MANGPDGCLWIIDMARELIEGAAFLPPQILKHMDVGSGVDRGRLWRVVPEGFEAKGRSVGKATTPELVALLEHTNGWHRDTASRLLYERQTRRDHPLASLPVSRSRLSVAPMRLSSLAGLGGLEPDLVLAALADPEPHVRELALRLAESFCKENALIQTRLEELGRDPEPLVRYQVAFSLGELSGTRPAKALAALAVRDGSDAWMRVAILSSVSGCAGEVFRQLADNEPFRKSAHGRSFLTTLVAQSGVATRPDELAAVLEAINGPLVDDPALSRDVVSSNEPHAARNENPILG